VRSWRGAITIAAPAVYVVALAVTVASWGLPLAHDQLFMWLLLGLAAFGIGAWRSWGTMLLAWLPLLALLVAYDYLRQAVAVDTLQAHVSPQIALDRWLGFGHVPTVWLQQHLWHGDPRPYDYAVWGVYMTHFFAVWIVAALLWRSSRRRFAHYSAVTVLLTMSAFLVYWAYPAQPPWLASDALHIGPVERIVPMVWDDLGVPTIQSVYDNGNLVNTVAAMPSLHAAYPMMLALFFWAGAGPRLRALLVSYVLAMAFALVYSGEHFVSDILAGWLMAGCAVAVVALARRRLLRPRVGAPAKI